MSGFSFGTQPNQPAAPGTGFSFGAPKTTAVGTTTTAAPAFGATPAFGMAPAATTALPTFGAPAAAPVSAAPAFSFGTPTTAPAATAAAPTLSFGTGNLGGGGGTGGLGGLGTTGGLGGLGTTGGLGGLGTTGGLGGLGTTGGLGGLGNTGALGGLGNTGALGGLGTTGGLGGLTNTGTGTSTGVGTGTGLTMGTGLGNLGGLGATPATTTTAAVPTLGLGGGAFNFGKLPTTTAAGAPATTAATLNFGTTTTAATGTGIFGKPATTTLGATAAPAAAAAPFVGLGGIDVSSTQPKEGDSKKDHIKVKETQVPDEIAKTVDALKVYIKAQKTLASDIGRTSTSKLTAVSGEITNMQNTLQEISNSVDTTYNQIKMLRKDTTRAIQSVEMAQRTQDTPPGLQFENVAPFQYFQNLVTKYEQDLNSFRQHIESTERHMQSLACPQPISPVDLKRGFQQINESFVSLAGRLHEIHQNVEAQKEQFLQLRKYRQQDTTNVFAKLDCPETNVNAMKITSGPTPFSSILASSSFGKSMAPNASTAGQQQAK